MQRSSTAIFANVDDLLTLAFELLQSLQGERSENVVRSYAKRGEDSIFSVVGHQVMSFRSLTLARTTIIAPGEQKLAAPCPW